MTRARITLYVFTSLLVTGATFLIIYGNSQSEAEPVEPLQETETEVVISAPEEITSTEADTLPAEAELEEVKKVEPEIIPAPPKPKTTVDPAPKVPAKEVPKPPVETEIIPVTFSASAMLAAHNAVRQKVDVSPLVYSQSLAQSAQKWSDKLQANNCSPQHDTNTPYGENLYWSSYTGGSNSGLEDTPAIVVNAWASEKADYNYSKNSCAPGKVCGHYTQIVWEDSTEVGCGVSICQKGKTQTEVWVCRYNPPGNYIGEKPY